MGYVVLGLQKAHMLGLLRLSAPRWPLLVLKGTDWGPQGKEPQPRSRNMIGMYLGPSIPGVFLLHFWVSLSGIPTVGDRNSA